jgi:hypothetical protein
MNNAMRVCTNAHLHKLPTQKMGARKHVRWALDDLYLQRAESSFRSGNRHSPKQKRQEARDRCDAGDLLEV